MEGKICFFDSFFVLEEETMDFFGKGETIAFFFVGGEMKAGGGGKGGRRGETCFRQE